MYEYRAIIMRIVDGDTFWAKVDLGFNLSAQLDFRILGIDAPECVGVNRTAGLASAAILAQLMPIGSTCLIRTAKGDSFGRWLAEIILEDGRDVAQEMIHAGAATIYRRRL